MISVGSSLVNYKLAVQSRDRLLEQFQKTPTFKRAVDYYRQNIGKVTSPEDLLKDRRLLEVALSAFQLESEINSLGIFRKLLTEDPSDPKSLAQRLIDPRYRQFAQAFASLRSDGGKQIGSATNINLILDRFQTNEFEKFLGQTDPTVREALYFKRTIQDTIEIKNLSDLMAQFKKSPGIADAVKYYRENVKSVQSVNDLLKDDRILAVVLTAYDLDALLTDKETVERLLTEDPDAPGALAQIEPRYKNFAKALYSLRYDSGAQLHTAEGINALIAAFENNAFERSLTLTDTSASREFAQYLAGSSTEIHGTAAYYRENVENVTSIEALLADDQLLDVVLTAFDLGAIRSQKAALRMLLIEDPEAPDSLAQSDPRLMQFAKMFETLKTDGGAKIQSSSDVEAIIGAFETKRYFNSLTVVQAASYYRDNIGNVSDVDAFVNDGMLLHVALSAFDLGSLLNSPDTVRQLLTEDPEQPGSLAQTDPRYLSFARAFQSLNVDGGVEIKGEAGIDAILRAFSEKPLQSGPDPAQSVAYYRANIDKVQSVSDLLADGELLHVLLSAYDLGELINDKAAVRALLTELTVLPNALARKDPRLMRFAQDFASFNLGNRDAFRDSVDAVVHAFENKLLQGGTNDADLIGYYQDRIGTVTDVDGLLGDEQLLTVALAAFGLRDLVSDKATVERLLTEDPNGPFALATIDPRYAAFASAFATLKSDGGAKIHSKSDIEAITAAYRTSEAERLFSLINPASRTGLYGKDGEKTIGELRDEFTGTTAYAEEVAYFRAQITRVSTVDQLLADKRLLDITLSAFRIDDIGSDVVRALLMQDPAQPDSLAQSDPRYMRFAQEFASLKSRQPIRNADRIESMIASYTSNEFQKSLESRVRQAVSSGGKLTITQLLADRTLAKVTREGLYLPTQLAALELEQQIAAMKRAGLDPAKLQNPAELDRFINQFLVKVSMDQAASTPSLVTMLFQPNPNPTSTLLSLIPSGGVVSILA